MAHQEQAPTAWAFQILGDRPIGDLQRIKSCSLILHFHQEMAGTEAIADFDDLGRIVLVTVLDRIADGFFKR